MGIELPATERAQAERLVTRHFVALRSLPETVEGEWKRSESSLEVYRQLRDVAGRAAADAYYDLFRPGLVDRATVERLEDGAIERVLKDRADYVAAYEETCRKLERRYGESTLNVVLARLAPNDRRGYRDAWIRLAFDPESPCLWTRELDAMDLPTRSGKDVRVRAGFAEDVDARFVKWDHLPGGWVILPPQSADVDLLTFEVDGVRYEVER